MGYIHYDLSHSANCAGMAPAVLAHGGFGNATLPGGMGMAGTYIIVNTTENNRYVGISSNINNRFNTRMAVITEMGFGDVTMAAIGVVWGHTYVRDTAPWVFGFPGAGPPWALVAPHAHAAFQAGIDGVQVNLERLLIRFCLIKLNAGGTVSNNVMAPAPYANPTVNTIQVRLTWGAVGHYVADFQTHDWDPGVPW